MFLGGPSREFRVSFSFLRENEDCFFADSTPAGSLPPSTEGQWWELSDETRSGLPYYYHTVTGETRWDKPESEFVIPLRIIQVSALLQPCFLALWNTKHLILDSL